MSSENFESCQEFFETQKSIIRERRPEQEEMARCVEAAFKAGSNALIEAGTGVGKSFAYLVPAIIHSLQNPRRIVVSTATKNLQNQLFKKDLPALQEIFGEELTFENYKGQNNYVCTSEIKVSPDRKSAKDVQEFLEWADASVEGRESGELQVFETIPRGVKNYTAEECIGRSCKNFKTCPYPQRRARMLKARVVVVNHHLCGLNLAYGGNILEDVDHYIFDEAHKIPEAFRSVLTKTLRRHSLKGLLDKVPKDDIVVSNPNERYDPLEILNTYDDFRKTLPPLEKGQNYRLLTELPKKTKERSVEALEKTLKALGKLTSNIQESAKLKRETKEYLSAQRLAKFLFKLERVFRALDHTLGILDGQSEYLENRIGYLSMGFQGPEVNVSPIGIQGLLKNLPESNIFTSATLAVGRSFKNFQFETGIECESAEFQKVLTSPFNYKENALLFTPKKMPLPPNPFNNSELDHYSDEVIKRIKAINEVVGGNVFCLFTSNFELKAVANKLQLGSQNPILIQQDGVNAARLLESYNEACQESKHPILLGLKSFWEGVSVEGTDLKAVIIVKIPFPPQSDPIYTALCQQAGNKAFPSITMPLMINDIKQGAGRLIRTKTDQGIVAILDARLHTKRYGQTIIRSLPFPTRANTIKGVRNWWGNLSKNV